MHLIPPPAQILHNHFFFFISPGIHPSKEQLKTNFGGQVRCIMGDVQVANYKDLTTCEFNLLSSPLPYTPQMDYPRFEVSGSLAGSLKKKKKMATSIQRYSSRKEEIFNSDCSAWNNIKQPHQNRRMHLHMKIKQRKGSWSERIFVSQRSVYTKHWPI